MASRTLITLVTFFGHSISCSTDNCATLALPGRPARGSVRVVAVLERADSREDDLRQILTLAEAFRNAAE